MAEERYWCSVNGADAHRLVVDYSLGLPGDAVKAEPILLDPALDWEALGNRIAVSGLARGMGAFLDHPIVEDRSPVSFRAEVREAALGEGIKLAVTRTVLRKISEKLEGAGTHGVLLKGAALTVRSWILGEPVPAKTPGDIDILVPPERALEVRNALLEEGFEGEAQTEFDESHHHLEPVSFQNLVVEIHTRISEKSWRLPEEEMLLSTEPLPGWEPLRMLGPEAYLIHSSIHLGRHFYAFGLKTMWGQRFTLLDRGEEIDWDKLAGWATALRDPRRFWIPVQVFGADLAFPFPASFLAKAPEDSRQRRLCEYARNRLHVIEDAPPLFDPGRWRHEALVLGSGRGWLQTLIQKLPRLAGRGIKRIGGGDR